MGAQAAACWLGKVTNFSMHVEDRENWSQKSWLELEFLYYKEFLYSTQATPDLRRHINPASDARRLRRLSESQTVRDSRVYHTR